MLASLIFGFISVQNMSNVDRVLSSPPGPVAKDIEDLGIDITRQLLRYQASQFNRFLTETWGVAQIGLGAAILSAVLFTAHRSRFLIFATCVMILIAIFQVSYIVRRWMRWGEASTSCPWERPPAKGIAINPTRRCIQWPSDQATHWLPSFEPPSF